MSFQECIVLKEYFEMRIVLKQMRIVLLTNVFKMG